MAQDTKIGVTMGDQSYVRQIDGPGLPGVISPRSGKMKIRLLKPQIIGNWGYNEGEVIEVSAVLADSLVRNGVAVVHKEDPAPPKKRPGWPKGKPRKKKS